MDTKQLRENQKYEIIQYKKLIIDVVNDIDSLTILKIIYRYITATKG